MIYKNGRDVIPHSLLRELQKYVNGELIYIPKLEEKRARWGEVSGTRKLLAERNREICRLHEGGSSVADLERMYFLSGESIRKIIMKKHRQPVAGGGTHAETHQASGEHTQAIVRRAHI
ncbi:CD3324 family protein [Cohnella soli]|uniref:CD3324 family protein n=1 Tax=Cohnella soli TaxID=425005 RepID=A0ABW0I4H8_9BACL